MYSLDASCVPGRPDVSALNSSMIGVLGRSLWITVHVCANPQPSRSHWLLGRYVLSPGDAANAHPHYIAHPYRVSLEGQKAAKRLPVLL